MRLRACTALLLLLCSACAHIPDHLFIDIDGNTIEVIKKPAAPADGETN